MLHDFVPPVNVFDCLNAAPDNFYLTGSQFFYGHGNDTDFYVQNRPGLSEWLISIGFRLHGSSNYSDTNCEAVYRHRKIDIQLVSDVTLKTKVQMWFKSKGILNPTTEQWNLAFEFFRVE